MGLIQLGPKDYRYYRDWAFVCFIKKKDFFLDVKTFNEGDIVTAMTSVTGNRGQAGSGLAPLVYSLAHKAALQLFYLNLG